MNGKFHTNNTGITIIPSARKGIHSHCTTCLAKRIGDMGKYGVETKRNNRNSHLSHHQNPSSLQDEGRDEVDNVKRDCANQSSPKSNIRNTRKNSIDSMKHIYSDESDDEDTSEEFNSLETLAFTPERARENESNTSNNNNSMIYDEIKFHTDVTNLGQKYKVTDDSILQIQTGISTIFQRQDAGSFIFTYNSQSSHFDPTLFNNFMNDIASTAARYLRNDTDVRNHVIVDSKELEMRVHGELIERYREDVSRTGVMLVKDLDEVPAPLAMAFHYYCDEFNPLIKRSAIFFTLNMAKCSDKKTSHASIEKCLSNKWTTVSKVNIVPLLARIVSIVVDVTSVF
ncbi:unnamed protein product, partial [Iphiclides podalirius]